MLRELLDVHRRVLGVDHPGTLRITVILADSLDARGRHLEAEQMRHEKEVGLFDDFANETLAVFKGMANHLRKLKELAWPHGGSR